MAHPVPVEAAVTAARAVLIADTVVETQTKNLFKFYLVLSGLYTLILYLGWEELEVYSIGRGGETELAKEALELVDIVIGVEHPQLGPHSEQLLL